MALDRARQPARAVMIGEECLERREKLNMENTSEHVHSLNNLGLSLISAGQYERAIEVLQKCLIHSSETPKYYISEKRTNSL